MVSYFAFDLDETLGQLHTPFYFLRELLPERHRLTERVDRGLYTPSPELREILQEVYTNFVALVAKEEIGTNPLGILRPGILQVLQAMIKLKEVGKFGGAIIYSNNDSPPTLDFTKDIIEASIGEPVFCDVIYRTHPMRDGIDFNVERTVNDVKKTWTALKHILENGPCGATDVQPSQVYFFDDLRHPDLLANLPPGHYIQVSPYSFRASFDRLADLYLLAYRQSSLFRNETLHDEFAKYLASLSNVKEDDEWIMDSHIRAYKEGTKPTSIPDRIPPPPDTSVMNMKGLMRFIGLPQSAGRRRGTQKRSKHRKTRRYNRRRNNDRILSS